MRLVELQSQKSRDSILQINVSTPERPLSCILHIFHVNINDTNASTHTYAHSEIKLKCVQSVSVYLLEIFYKC